MSRRSTRLLAALVAALATFGTVAPAHAQVIEPTVPPDISPALDDIEVDSPEYRLVAADYELVKAARLRAAARLVALAVEERDLAAGEARAGADARLARTQAVRWRRRVGNLAVRAYIGAGGDDAAVLGGLDPGYNRPERRALLFTEVDRHWRVNLAASQSELAAAEVRRERLGRRHQEVLVAQTRTEAARAEALAEERRLRPTVAAARATAIVVGSDLTLVALDAYLRATFEVNDQMPGCHLPWWLLAGIGRVESGHGTFATSVLDPGGTARPSIIGIALDGGNSTAVITDSDGGVLDGDLRSDRAVGPMQFIPSTWARYAADGNGDGVADPQNLYDAAHAAGRYLCTAAGDLSTDAGVHRGIYAYNHSDAYVSKVLGFAQEYIHLLT